VKMKECLLILSSFVIIVSDHTTTSMGRKLAVLKLIHFLVELLFSGEANENTVYSLCNFIFVADIIVSFMYCMCILLDIRLRLCECIHGPVVFFYSW
jgi:hypothetical protein